jgi:hypothetical protein
VRKPRAQVHRYYDSRRRFTDQFVPVQLRIWPNGQGGRVEQQTSATTTRRHCLTAHALTHSSRLAVGRLHLFNIIVATGAHERTERVVQLKSPVREKPFPFSRIQPYVLSYTRTAEIVSSVKVSAFNSNHDQTVRLRNAARLVRAIHQLCHPPTPPAHATLPVLGPTYHPSVILPG